MARYAVLYAGLVCALMLSGCSQIDATADPVTGRITTFRYRGYFRQYDASLVENKDGTRTIIIGARSEIDKVTDFLKTLGALGIGAVTGAAAGPAMVP